MLALLHSYVGIRQQKRVSPSMVGTISRKTLPKSLPRGWRSGCGPGVGRMCSAGCTSPTRRSSFAELSGRFGSVEGGGVPRSRIVRRRAPSCFRSPARRTHPAYDGLAAPVFFNPATHVLMHRPSANSVRVVAIASLSFFARIPGIGGWNPGNLAGFLAAGPDSWDGSRGEQERVKYSTSASPRSAERGRASWERGLEPQE